VLLHGATSVAAGARSNNRIATKGGFVRTNGGPPAEARRGPGQRNVEIGALTEPMTPLSSLNVTMTCSSGAAMLPVVLGAQYHSH
jgi:hypothetical protein